MDGDSLFFNHRRHGEALASRAAYALRRGEFAAAYRYADRLCRSARPKASDYLLRSEASRGAGFAELADTDLHQAAKIDPNDQTVLRLLLSRGDAQVRRTAALALIADPAGDLASLRLAVAELMQGGDRAVLLLRPLSGRLVGWAAWRRDARPSLLLQSAGAAQNAQLEADAQHFLADTDRDAAALAFDSVELIRIALMDGERELAGWAPTPRSPPPPRAPQTAKLWIIVPVYEDFEATRACLTATMAQLEDTGARLVAIDDASPNAALRGWLDIHAASGRLELIRNPENLGFAASVNRALSLCLGGDVVLLNADALPPPGVFGRLAALARSAPDIGALTPLSNNGETCSFPAPNASSPLPPEDEVARLDTLARRANGDHLIDLPNGIGFCLYITRACLEAVGALPEIYGRGYYEDVEFCLRAREKGFRTVCASGVYVGHAGSLSFGAEKRRLVTKNLRLLKSRFPAHEAECAAFLRFDPLKNARGAIERLDPPRRAFRLLAATAGAGALEAQAEARRRVAGGEAPLLCLYDPALQCVSLRGPGGAAPQSLEFSLRAPGGLDELRDWLGQLDLSGVTVFFSSTLPAALVELFASINADLELVIANLDFFVFGGRPNAACAQPEGLRPCPDCAGAISPAEGASASLRDWQAAVRQGAVVRPLDRMIGHVARSLFPDAPLAEPPACAPRTPDPKGGQVPGGQVLHEKVPHEKVLGVLSPTPEAGADALIVTLARALRRRGDPARLVVFGRCLDDLQVMAPGNVFVTGAVEQEDIAGLTGLYGITELMCCSRTRFIGRLDSLASACDLARAGFDWSSGALAFDQADLALDPRLCDLKIAERVADWLGERRAAEPAGEAPSAAASPVGTAPVGTSSAGKAKKVKAR